MNKYKDGRYTYYIIPEQGIVKCVSTYAKRPVVGMAVCRAEDTFDEDIGKRIAKAKCDKKINTKRIKYLKEVADVYYESMRYYMMNHGRICVNIRKAEEESRRIGRELNDIEELYK